LVGKIAEHIQELSFGEFELFGACLLKELGATQVRVTPHSEDQGIDFFGNMSIGDVIGVPPSLYRLAHDIKLQFVGQAKHYPNRPIGPNHLRELVGAISLARYKLFTSDPEVFSHLELQPFNPIVLLLFTTGRFTRGARHLASEAGIIARSVEQIAIFLADSSVGIRESGGDADFDEGKFQEWLSA
jgi:hypothetical protein